MNTRTWVILGATSAIAEAFAHLAAKSGQDLILVGRHQSQLELIAADITLRYKVPCAVIKTDFANDVTDLIQALNQHSSEIDMFIAHSMMIDNNQLSSKTISALIQVNITSTIQLIHAYWQKNQSQHRLLYLSSVAACKGRAKNSLYGASKTAVEVYLEGLQQAASDSQQITIARLGYIDTHMTYGLPGIFYASPPEACAEACWQAIKSKKRKIYHPFFWRYIMAIITGLPFFMYRRMKV